MEVYYLKITKVMEKFARRCDVTGEPMNEGWCWGEGTFYTATEEATIAELRKEIAEGYNPTLLEVEVLLKESDEVLLEIAYEDGLLYWTEWYSDEVEEQGFYYTADGEEVVCW